VNVFGRGEMGDRQIRDLEDRIAEIRLRIPPHSVPPAMLEELDELEQELEKARRQAEDA
jgi:hypothetical protein